MPRYFRRSIGFVVAAMLASAAGHAQNGTVPARIGPPPGIPAARFLTNAEVAESLAVLRQLQSAEKARPQDAAAWFHSGMIAWGLLYRARNGPPHRELDWTLLGRLADTSFRIAVQLDKSNPLVALRAGQFFLGTGPITMRVQSYHLLHKAYDLTRQGTGTTLHSEAAIEVGRLYWRRYDGLANRRMEVGESDVVRSLASMPNQLTQALSNTTQIPIRPQDVMMKVSAATMPLPPDLSGAGDYLQAEEKFREAYAITPTDDRAFHELAMLYAEKKRWSELGGLARERIRRTPRDAQAWLALGLALQRTRKTDAATAAFDSALRFMEPRERNYFTRLQRVMAPQDTAGYAALPAAERTRREREYWLFVEPLWSHGGNNAYTEFLARAAFADLRWSVEELGQRGIDSDRGDIHVRYGPPTIEAVLGPAPQRGDLGSPLTDAGFADLASPVALGDLDEILRRASISTIWAYDVGWLVIFRGSPTYGTSHIAPEDAGAVDSLVNASPSLWNNVVEETIRDMPTQVARFRAPHDSVDVMIATEPPVSELRELAGSNAKIRANLWLFGRDNSTQLTDSQRLAVAAPRTWTYRLPPAQYAYRIETTSDGAMLAGRAADWIDTRAAAQTGFAAHGFGLSDLLLAERAEERGATKRWSDLDIAPIGGSVSKSAQVALVWENYDLGAKDGAAAYSVTITLERRYKMLLNRIKARVVGSLAAMVGIDRTEDRLVFRYERTAASAPIVVDHLTIGLEDSPPGLYILTLEVLDHATGLTTSRTQRFTIRE